MAMGRPTKYNHKLLLKAKKFLENYQKTELVEQKNIGTAENPVMIPKVNVYFIWAICAHLNVSESTLAEWCNKGSQYYKKEFSETIEGIKTITKERLATGSITGVFKEKSSRFLLGVMGVIDENKKVQPASPVTINNFSNILDSADAMLKKKKEDIIEASIVNASEREESEVKAIPATVKENLTVPPKTETPTVDAVEELKKRLISQGVKTVSL